MTPNPKDTEVESGGQAYLASHCDVLVAVGGGSCIDAAKAIAVLAAGGGRIADYAGVGTVTGPLPPTVMVPTTGGSGSDVSQFCVVTDTRRKTKVTIGARALVPDISVTDPQVLTTVPPDITAYTALDVLSHGIESYVSKAANFLSDVQALAAIRGVTEHLFPALDHPGDVQARDGLARASLQAGLAFTTGLLGATHAISHQIGGLTDLPHGLLNAIMLPHVMEFNAPVATERLADVAAAMGVHTGLMSKCEAADAAIQTVRALAGKASLPASLREIGVRIPQLGEVARNALDDAYIVTNPRPVDLKLSDSAPAEGLDVCARLRDGQPQVSIVVLTTFLDQKLLVGALQRGASGYALKDVDAVELARIIRTVHRGESGFDGRSAQLVVRSLTGQPAAPARLLSERELEVVRLVARGDTNAQAARDLYVSESTIKYHLRLAMRKLGAKDRTELVYRASG